MKHSTLCLALAALVAPPVAAAPPAPAIAQEARSARGITAEEVRTSLADGKKGLRRLAKRFEAETPSPEVLRVLVDEAPPDGALRLLTGLLVRPDCAWRARIELGRLRALAEFEPRDVQRACRAAKLDARTTEVAEDAVLGVDADTDAERLNAWAAGDDTLLVVSALESMRSRARRFRNLAEHVTRQLASGDEGRTFAAARALLSLAPPLVATAEKGPVLGIGGGGVSGDRVLFVDLMRHRRTAGGTGGGGRRPRGLGRNSEPAELARFALRWEESVHTAFGGSTTAASPRDARAATEGEMAAAGGALAAARTTLASPALGADAEEAVGRALMAWNQPDDAALLAAAREIADPAGDGLDAWFPEAVLRFHAERLGDVAGLEAALAPAGEPLRAGALAALLAQGTEAALTVALRGLTDGTTQWNARHFALAREAAFEPEQRAILAAHGRERLAAGDVFFAPMVRDQGAAALPTIHTLLGSEGDVLRLIGVALAGALGADGETLLPTLRRLEEEGAAQDLVFDAIRAIEES